MGSNRNTVIKAVCWVAVILGSLYILMKYNNNESKSWDNNVIKAKYLSLEAQLGETVITTFKYTVENTGSNDYYFPKDDNSAMVRVPGENAYAYFDQMQWDKGIYIPSKKKIVVSFVLPFELNGKFKVNELDNSDILNEFFKSKMKDIDGFVILDKNNRVEIQFLNGWEAHMKK